MPSAHDHQPVGLSALAQASQAIHQQADGFVPGDGLPLAAAPLTCPAQGARDPIRVVKNLQADLALGAQPALVDG